MTEVRTVAEVDKGAVDEFLARHFRPAKAAFLREHGTWWHRGDENRWVLVENGAILGYCAVIPARITVEGNPVDASWWVDLVIDPAARGRKLQRHFDDLIRARPLTLGFPNAIAAAIHRRHGWGVREDLAVRVLPIAGSRMPSLRSRPLLRPFLGPLLTLAGRLWRPRPGSADTLTIDDDAIDALVGSAQWSRQGLTRTTGSRAWFEHRYLESPHRAQLVVISYERTAVVLRVCMQDGSPVGRILDIVGSVDRSSMSQIVGAAAAYCRSQGASQLSALASNSEVHSALSGAGLKLAAQARFCWFTRNSRLTSQLADRINDWKLGDADHDEP